MRRTLPGVVLAVVACLVGSAAALAQSGPRGASNPPQPAHGGASPRPTPTRTYQPGPRAAAALREVSPADSASHRPSTFDPTLNRSRSDSSSDDAGTDTPEPRRIVPVGRIGQNLNGQGPSRFYGGANLQAHHSGLRPGTHANATIPMTGGRCHPARHQVLTNPVPPRPDRPVPVPAPRTTPPPSDSPGARSTSSSD